jgi:pimeloyl-ACP methyl ester carboxylesterase
VPSRVVAAFGALTALVVSAGLVAACTVGPSNPPGLVVAGQQPPATTAAADTPKPLPPLEKPDSGQISWSGCMDTVRLRLGDLAPANLDSMTFQCARVVGPLGDAGDPAAGIARLSLLKVGTGPTPLLVLNDLDGLPGTLYAARLAAQLPPQVLSTFSLIGVDRRGTASSDGVHCVPQEDRDSLVDADPADTDLTGFLDASHDGSQQCVLELDTRMAQLNTERTAADLELIRQRLGVAHLNAIGHGEGSRVLTVYADEHPQQVGRLVLDGSPDPTLNSTDTAQQQATAADATYQAFGADCLRRGNCPLGNDPKAALQQLVTQLRAQPEPAAEGAQLTAGSALRAVLQGLADRTQWPQLAQGIAAAKAGNPNQLDQLIEPVSAGTTYDPARLDARLASGCNDLSDRLSPGQVAADVKDWSAKDPLFGGVFGQDLLLCAPWPVAGPPLPKPTAKGTPPILVLATADDPVTPQTGSQRTAQSLVSGVLVNWAGAGHGALGFSPCVTAAAQNFLVAGKVPADSTACPA